MVAGECRGGDWNTGVVLGGQGWVYLHPGVRLCVGCRRNGGTGRGDSDGRAQKKGRIQLVVQRGGECGGADAGLVRAGEERGGVTEREQSAKWW
jgi:hypothetical protein